MKNQNTYSKFFPVLLFFLVGGFLTSCDFLDPTEVTNPQTTGEDLARANEPVRALMPGLEAQFARALGSNVVVTETISDNYSVNGTGISSTFDFPGELNVDVDATNATGAATGAYWNASELRALASFVIDDIIPADDTANDAEIARVFYYRGMANLFQGENFVSAMLEREGEPVSAQILLQRAAEDFNQSLSIINSGQMSMAARAALARTHRSLGNAAEAAQFAQSVIDTDPEFLFTQPFDDNLANPAQAFLVARALKELQPLPRLDFLDPKYPSRSSAIPVAKAEEMYLILAEVSLSGTPDLVTARGHLVSAINLATDEDAGRVLIEFNDDDQRLDNQLNSRPRHSVFDVKAGPDAPARSGLVLTRPGAIQTPAISSTSFTEQNVNDANNADELIYLLYNLRQEILFLEGRRLHDLGIRVNFMLREIDSNVSLTRNSLGSTAYIPSYIPSGNNLDLFEPSSPYPGGEPDDSTDPTVTTTVITISHDINAILSAQRGTVLDNPFVGVPGL